MKKPDLLILVIVWQFLSAFMALIALLSITIIAFPDAPTSMLGSALPGFILGIGLAVLILLAFIIISVMAAAGIIRNQEWGRIMGIVQAALSVFAPPVGTVAGILILVYLLRPDVEGYFKASQPIEYKEENVEK
jgi:hypothetical protein